MHDRVILEELTPSSVVVIVVARNVTQEANVGLTWIMVTWIFCSIKKVHRHSISHAMMLLGIFRSMYIQRQVAHLHHGSILYNNQLHKYINRSLTTLVSGQLAMSPLPIAKYQIALFIVIR